MGLWPNEIMTPVHLHGVRDALEYRAKQRAYITNGRRTAPALNWRDPWLSLEKPEVLILAGKWICWCECGNYPSVHPLWRLACCFECGAIYEGLTMPADAEVIAAVLAKRPRIATRAWLPPQSVEELRAENRAQGLEA
jgi:hypothetical protein